jgi:hypothetical protein
MFSTKRGGYQPVHDPGPEEPSPSHHSRRINILIFIPWFTTLLFFLSTAYLYTRQHLLPPTTDITAHHGLHSLRHAAHCID